MAKKAAEKAETTRAVTLEQFDYLSREVAEFLRSFGNPKKINDDLLDLANLGADATLFVEPWADKIVVVSDYKQPARFRPWTDEPDKEISARCANLCGAFLLSTCWRIIFKENPPFKRIKGVEVFHETVGTFIADNLAVLTERTLFVSYKMNYSEWLALAEQMEIERVRLMSALAPKPSPAATRETWLEWHKKAGREIGLSTFERRIKKGPYVVLSQERGRWVLDINTLPLEMQSLKFWVSLSD